MYLLSVLNNLLPSARKNAFVDDRQRWLEELERIQGMTNTLFDLFIGRVDDVKTLFLASYSKMSDHRVGQRSQETPIKPHPG